MLPILVEFGPVVIYSYGAMLAIAFLVGAKIGAKRAAKAGLSQDHPYNIALWAFFASLLGARFVHIAVENPKLLSKPGEWLRFWDGGLVFYGGFIAALVAAILYARVKRVPFFQLGDILAPSIALGHGIVRIGCFLNGCCFGKPASWGIVFTHTDKVPRQPTQLYEAAAGVLLFFALLAWDKRKRFEGELIAIYIAAYGLTRFLIELVRDDWRGNRLLGLTISMWIGLAGLAVGGFLLVVKRRAHGAAPPAQA